MNTQVIDFRAAQGENDLRERVRYELEISGLSANKASKEIGFSPTTLSNWLRGIHAGDKTMVLDRVKAWLQSRADQHLHQKARTVHANLAATQDIMDDLTAAQVGGDCAVIYGRAGAGKTYALWKYAASRSGVTVTTMSPAVTSPMGTLTRIGLALEVEAGTRNAAALEDVLVDRLTGRGALLIVDEAHHLTAALLDEVRVLHDRSGCGLAFVGNDPLWPRLASSDRAAQLVSRVGIRRHLGAPLVPDIHALASALLGRALKGKEPGLLSKLGRRAGGLRIVAKTMRDAYSLAREAKRDKVSATDIQNAILLRDGQ